MLLWAWAIFLPSTMMYIMPSGLPQPSALLFGAMLFLVLLDPFARTGPALQAAMACLAAFVAWCAVVSVGHFFWAGELVYLKAPLYYFYNALVFVAVVQLVGRDPDRFARVTRNALAMMLLLQLAFIFLYPSRLDNELEREIGTFNAPNQLAYWSILTISTYMLLPDRRLFVDLVVIAAGGWVVVASASKSGLLAMSAAFLLWLALDCWREGRAMAITVAALVVLIVAGGVAYRGSVALPDNERVELVRQRVDRSTPENDDTLMGRGYTTFVNHPSLLPFGAGEGNFRTLTKGDDGVFLPGEMHSTLGVVLQAYGIVGFILFLTFLVTVGRSGGLVPSLWLLPGLIYGVAHQGLRFSPFWIMLACVAAARYLSTQRRRRQVSVPLSLRATSPQRGPRPISQVARAAGGFPHRAR